MNTGRLHGWQPIRILIVDSDGDVRRQVRGTLQHHDDIEVAGEAADGDEALGMLERIGVDVALVGLAHPGGDALDTCRRITAHASGARTVMMAGTSCPDAVVHAFDAGCFGFCKYRAGAEILGIAIRAANHGGSFLCPTVARPVIDRYLRRVAGPAGTHESLTVRQREVLRMVAYGWRTKEIARALNLSTKTVESHRAAIMRRLGVSRVVEMVHEATRLGLAPAHDTDTDQS